MSVDKPICVFDSGLGGLTVVRELMAEIPGEDIVYLGDSARVPYGIKSLETIQRFAMEDASYLMRFDPKMLVVACNTASAAAIDVLRAALPVDVIDVIGPSASEAIATTDEMIGVIATEATISSEAYQRSITNADSGREVMCAACPLLVPIVEEGRAEDDPIVLHVLTDYLHKLQRARLGALILGCTHYPLLSEAIGKLMGPDVPLINSGRAAALAVKQRLEETDSKSTRTDNGGLRCITTDNPRRFATLAERFGGRRIEDEDIKYIGTDELVLCRG